MNKETLRVVALIRARSGEETKLEGVLSALIEPTRREPGCLFYELYRRTGDPTDFVFVEEWESDAALDAHMETPHVRAALAKVPELLAQPPDIRRYRRVR
jgi:quinol monooxygenase YgiN